MELRQKTIENTLIVFVVTFFNRGLNVLTRIILARLLFPEDFGLVAIASIIINAIALFREIGIESALIYRKDKVDEAADTAFIMLPIIGVLLYSGVYFLAPHAANFYNETAVSNIVRVSGITLLFMSLSSIPITLFTKRLDFRSRMTPEVVSTITYAVATITLALKGFRVWSLVYGGVIAGFVGLVTVWLITPYRPKIRFNKILAKEMIGYGKYVLGAQIVIFVLTNLDNAVVGKMLDMTALGFYAMAYSIASIPATNVTHIVGKILFPTYSILQDDRKKLGEMFLKVVRYVSFLTVPSSFGLFIFAPELVEYVLGVRWAPVIPALRILSFYGLLRSINATTGDLFKAVGDPKYLRDISIIQLVFMLVLIVPVTEKWGLIGVSFLVLSKGIIAFVLSFKKAVKEVEIDTRFLFNTIKPQCVSAALASLMVVSLLYSISPGVIKVVLDLIVFTVFYLGFMFFFDRNIFNEMRGMVQELRNTHVH